MRRGQVSLHVERNASASQQGKPGRETLQDRSAPKNGECWGLYLATKGFVVVALFVLPVLLIIMKFTEKALLLAVAMVTVVWMCGE